MESNGVLNVQVKIMFLYGTNKKVFDVCLIFALKAIIGPNIIIRLVEIC